MSLMLYNVEQVIEREISSIKCTLFILMLYNKCVYTYIMVQGARSHKFTSLSQMHSLNRHAKMSLYSLGV